MPKFCGGALIGRDLAVLTAPLPRPSAALPGVGTFDHGPDTLGGYLLSVMKAESGQRGNSFRKKQPHKLLVLDNCRWM